MKIRHKLLLGFLPIALLSVASMMLFSQRVARRVLVQEVVRHGRSTGQPQVASQAMVRGLRAANEQALLARLQGLMSSTGALYALVLDPAGRVLAHTNVIEKGKQYRDAISRRAIESEHSETARLEVRGRPVVDLSLPVWQLEERAAGEEFLLLGRPEVRLDERLGTVRLGLPLEDALSTAAEISRQVLWTISLGSLLTMLLILFYLRILLSPVQTLSQAARRIGAGQLGESVTVRADDELGELARTFNQMSRDLAGTTVSRDFLDSVLRNMQDIVIVADGDGTVQLVNQRAAHLLGRGEDDLCGQPVTGLFQQDPLAVLPPSGEDRRAATAIETTLRGPQDPPISVLMGVTEVGAGDTGSLVITATDITERKRAEQRIQASLEEKELLLKEIHHRVKNNLQIISSLLSLQAKQVEDERTLEMFSNSQNRISSMALIHDRLYRSDELARVDFADYVRDLADSLFRTYAVDSQRVELQLEVEDVLLGIDEAIPCGLILNELVLNALKHAFPGERRGILRIAFGRTGTGDNLLVVNDDGVGMPPGIDLETLDSLGVRLVTVLVSQLQGHLEVRTEGGTEFRITFPSRS